MTELTTYPTLRKTVQVILSEGRIRAARAVEDEKVATYWEVGRVLGENLLSQKDRADYGDQTLPRLAEDTGLSVQIFYECLKFYRQFPILHAHGQIGWSHYRQVFALKSPEERDFYLVEASEKQWSVRQLRGQIQSRAFERSQNHGEISSAPNPNRGRLYMYAVYSAGEDLVLDLGFSVEEARPHAAFVDGRSPLPGHLVTSVPDHQVPGGFRLESADVDEDDRYTYRAELIRVVDGDTLRVRVDLGFGSAIRTTLRLRGINTPEVKTDEGEAAKAFVEQTLSDVNDVVIRTYWRGRFGRYLADVFYLTGEDNAQAIVDRGTYLNSELVAQGHALPAEG